MNDKVILDSRELDCIYKLRNVFSLELCNILKTKRPIIFLCIGTDRSTGDSLGPLVGEKLKDLIPKDFILYGTLENPVHAKNLNEILKDIKNKYNYPYIIAIDACLGKLNNIGNIILENKPLSPGAAMNKDLPKVGDLSITGIVNISGALEFMVLQNTRLYTVMHLANIISQGIYHSILKTIGSSNYNFNSLFNSTMTNLKTKYK
ncbi:spore protease YyaC [Clostridium botulinum]|uniref:Sporulation protein n=1 Tax=Clostridium botulinum C/D str. DC5 TaxID=1443128 RepID=A0A0A0IGB7_CLOBO|nr:spore protease YyaC [Clostridium botulinum]KEI01987.1 sporulation protein [Clostridium botulinum C/D str. BKT75002]KEI10089.1 sporulation protein [Clostridium botulinum C/D str. BKT2873]KGM98156.1 sporulation protein [Clostridium botulinum D str. CCUG 7971]KGM98610.1 sporulation protein [Clostridium botulinum C/D str. DC5]KOC50366.1 sporulation protein [Clostridium botulinum]